MKPSKHTGPIRAPRAVAAAVAAGLTAVVAVVALTSAPAAAGPSGPAPTAPAPVKPGTLAASVPPPCRPLTTTPPIDVPAVGVEAGPVLKAITAHLHSVPADRESGRYTVLVERFAAADTAIGDCTTTVTDTGTSTIWRDEITDSGVTYGVAMHPATEPAPAATRDRFGPGELPGAIPGRVPASPARLARLLDGRYPGPAGRVDGVGEIARLHDTPPAARRALLLVLAGVPRLRVHQGVTVDGRTGIAVTIDTDDDADHTIDSRHTLVIDAQSGEIYAYEQVLLNAAIGHNLGVTVPYSQSLTVITGRGRTDRAGVLPATGQPV